MLCKNQFNCLISACVALSWLALQVGGTTHMTQNGKVDRFKQRVDFERAIANEDTEKVVNAVWPNMLKAPGLDGSKWKIAAESMWSAPGGVAKEWTLRSAKEQIAIVLFVSSSGNAPAQDFLVSRATENMMRESPFGKVAVELGTLAVGMPPEAPTNLIWVFRNTCFDVRIDNSQVNVLGIAQWLQSWALENIIDKVELPPLPIKLIASKRKASIAERVEIETKLPAGTDSARYWMDLKFDKESIEIVNLDGLSAVVAGVRAGPTSIEALLVDTATLQSKSQQIELEIQP